ncbi:MAG: hypothetical protein N2Z72_01620 [Bacteroidales bacterium]|nr:hypothetical protein [Bacteroidales bacterium]
MKKALFLLLLFKGIFLLPQGIVVLHHQGSSQVFKGNNAFSLAYQSAQNGDTLYLSGGFFWFVNINKKLVIFGAGHHPDSTIATGQSIVQGNVILESDADSLYLEGLYINGNISYSSPGHKVDYVTIRRCAFNNISFTGNRSNPSLYNLIEQNVILSNADFSNTTHLVFRNNIFQNRFHHGYYALISNNIFLRSPYWSWYGGVPIYNTDYSIIRNNIFFSETVGVGFLECENNQILNNLFITTPDYTSNFSSGNYHDYPQSSIFINCPNNTFDYSYNYHLQNPAVLLGNDGTQVGIYGGSAPWKEGSVPKIPHIIQKNIASQTDSNGMLNIQIKVGAQNE